MLRSESSLPGYMRKSAKLLSIKRKITPRQFEKRMRGYAKNWHINRITGRRVHNYEKAHFDGETLMCAVLKQLGFKAGVTIFEKMYKEYSY